MISLILIIAVAFIVIVSLAFILISVKSKKDKGIVYGDEADKTSLGMDTDKIKV